VKTTASNANHVLHHQPVLNAQPLTLQFTTQCAPLSNQSNSSLKKPTVTVAHVVLKSFQKHAQLLNHVVHVKSGSNLKKLLKTNAVVHALLSVFQNQNQNVKTNAINSLSVVSTKTLAQFTLAKENLNVQNLILTELKSVEEVWNAQNFTVAQKSLNQLLNQQQPLPPFKQLLINNATIVWTKTIMFDKFQNLGPTLKIAV
jgi:hypothetical protein